MKVTDWKMMEIITRENCFLLKMVISQFGSTSNFIGQGIRSVRKSYGNREKSSLIGGCGEYSMR